MTEGGTVLVPIASAKRVNFQEGEGVEFLCGAARLAFGTGYALPVLIWMLPQKNSTSWV
jgi:hypothetical protein